MHTCLVCGAAIPSMVHRDDDDREDGNDDDSPTNNRSSNTLKGNIYTSDNDSDKLEAPETFHNFH